MRVRVTPKGTLARSIDLNDSDVELPDGATTNDLVTHLGLPAGPYIVVIGGQAVGMGHPLHDGDTVHLHPPTAGG